VVDPAEFVLLEWVAAFRFRSRVWGLLSNSNASEVELFRHRKRKTCHNNLQYTKCNSDSYIYKNDLGNPHLDHIFGLRVPRD
jgi:hypothetical protein